MKKKLFYLFALICSITLFTACSDDDKPETPPTVEDIVAEYAADNLKPTIEGVEVTTENIKVELAKTEASDKVTVILHNVVPGVPEFKIPDVEFAATTRSSYISTLKGEITDNVAGYNVKIDGIVDEKVLTVNIVLTEIKGEETNTSALLNLVYKGKMDIDVANIATPISMEQRVYILKPRSVNMAKRDTSMVKLQIQNFAFQGMELGDITLDTILVQKRGDVFAFNAENRKIKLKVIGEVTADLSGTIVGEDMHLNLNIDASGLKVGVAFAGVTVVENKIAKITQMSIDSDVVLDQTLSNSTFTFKVWENVPDAQLSFILKYELSEKAKVDSIVMHVKGQNNIRLSQEQIDGKQPIDFSLLKSSDDYLKFHLSAEDPNYTGSALVKMKRMDVITPNYTFDNWISNGEEGFMEFFEPEGWATSNGAATMLKAMKDGNGEYLYPQELDFPVSKAASGGAKVITVDTKGADMVIAIVPAITAGTLFLGNFSISLSNTLKSTKFGVPYTGKPSSFSGEYSYVPGGTYYKTVVNTIDGKKVVSKEEVPGETDKCSINAVLYEVANYDETLDGTNINTSDKIAAVALLNDGSSTNGGLKNFNIPFKYVKEYDATKKYKLAIVCSSSAKGDKFEGAPGSELVVKSLKID